MASTAIVTLGVLTVISLLVMAALGQRDGFRQQREGDRGHG